LIITAPGIILRLALTPFAIKEQGSQEQDPWRNQE
jgi:hypothetical protein